MNKDICFEGITVWGVLPSKLGQNLKGTLHGNWHAGEAREFRGHEPRQGEKSPWNHRDDIPG